MQIDKPKRFVANKNGWPYAFEHWLKTVGVANDQQLTPMDHYALDTYHKDWDEFGIDAPIYYSRAFQDEIERDRATPVQAQAVTLAITPVSPSEVKPKKQAERFLRALYAPYERGFIELRCIRFAHNEAEAAGLGLQNFGPAGANGSRTWRRCFPLADTIFDISELWNMAEAAANNLYEVYVGVLPRGTDAGRMRKDCIYEAGAVWAELDFDKQGGEEMALAKAKDAEPDIIVFSGGGLHLYWTMTTPLSLTAENRERFESGVQARQDKLKTDRTHDCTRILRLPGTINAKQKELRKVELLQCP